MIKRVDSVYCILVLWLIVMTCSCSRRNSIKVANTHQTTERVEAAGAPLSRPSVPTTRARKLTDLKLGPELTRDQVIAVWGPRDGDRGFGMPYEAYAMAQGQEVWFVFSGTSPRNLITALLVGPDGHDKVLFARGR